MFGFLTSFISVALAELGDKTQITLLMFASRYPGKRRIVFAGAMAAFFIADGGAVLLGGAAGGLVSAKWIKLVSGILFILFGLWTLKNGGDGDENTNAADARGGAASPFTATFLAFLLLELGDKTQMAAAVLAARFNAWAVLAGTLTAMAVLSAAAVWLGDKMAGRLNPKLISRMAAAIFIAVGAAAILL